MQRSIYTIWGGVIILLVGMVLGSCSCSPSPTDKPATRDASAVLAAANAHLDAGEIQYAYDALLAAMRVAPGDEKVFNACLEFVGKAAKDANDESLPLAEDIYQRAANLIPFLPLARLKDARIAHTQTGYKLFGSEKVTNSEDPLAEAESLLLAAQRNDLPTSARASLLHEVEAELASQARRAAMKPNDEESFWTRWREVKNRYEEVQKDVLNALYKDDCQPRIHAWVKKVEDIERAEVDLNQIHQRNEEIWALQVEGLRISRDLTPYLEAGIEAIQQAELEKRLTWLARLREWNYNRWALDRVEQVEQSGGSDLDKLRSLAVIDETRLAPYVRQRFSEVWDKFFTNCSKEDKLEATKLRILREFQP
jgi:hypothetical protein